jgi:hypothetical protein
MQQIQLTADQFASYPPEARRLLVPRLPTLQQLPLSFLPSLLREAIEYDYKFPAERASIDIELARLSSLSPTQIKDEFQAFSRFTLSPQLERFDWINQPVQFVEQLSAYLWSTQQLDAYRQAATAYGKRMRSATSAEPPAIPRLGIAVIGKGAPSSNRPLFRKLREHGTYFGKIKPENGLPLLLAAVADRARAHPMPYGHWYVDGGEAEHHSPQLTCISYRTLEPMRAALLAKMQTEIARPGMGPEQLRTDLVRLSPADLGVDLTGDAVLDHFQLKLFTEGSGTQIFSTTFAQWTAREALRRAQASTLLVRFAPRQSQGPMDELLSDRKTVPELDPMGSLIDADMAAYYQWINQQRLPGFQHSSFIVWFEDHAEAVAISPSLPRGTESKSAMNLGELIKLVTS